MDTPALVPPKSASADTAAQDDTAPSTTPVHNAGGGVPPTTGKNDNDSPDSIPPTVGAAESNPGSSYERATKAGATGLTR